MGSNWIRDLLDAIGTQVGDEDEGTSSSGVTSIGLNLSCGTGPDTEGVRGGGGGLLPLDGAVALLCPDAVVVVLGLEQLGASKVVTLDSTCCASEPLDTVSGGSTNSHYKCMSPLVTSSHL